MRIYVAIILTLSIACASETPIKEANTVDNQSTLRSILAGTETQCTKAADCLTRICQIGYCVTLSGATQEWMEGLLAQQTTHILEDKPALSSMLTKEIKKLLEEDQYVQARVAGFLGLLGRDEFTDVLIQLSEETNARVRERAIVALGRLGHIAVFDRLVALTRHQSLALSLSAMEALVNYAKLPATKKRAIAVLIEALSHDNHYLRKRAIGLLGVSGVSDENVLQALEGVLSRPGDGFLRFDAFEAIVQLDSKRFASTAALLGTVETQ